MEKWMKPQGETWRGNLSPWMDWCAIDATCTENEEELIASWEQFVTYCCLTCLPFILPGKILALFQSISRFILGGVYLLRLAILYSTVQAMWHHRPYPGKPPGGANTKTMTWFQFKPSFWDWHDCVPAVPGFLGLQGELREKLHRHCLCLPAAHQRIHL